MELKQKLNDIMTDKNLTRQQLAAILNVDAAQVTRWMAGKQCPRPAVYLAIQKLANEHKPP